LFRFAPRVILYWVSIVVIGGGGCKGGNENTDLPSGLVFEDYASQIVDSSAYPLWVFGSAGQAMPDDASGVSGALDNDTATAWLTEPGCGQGAFFVLYFDSLAASTVRVELGQHLWLAVPDSFFVRWNEGPWQGYRYAATIHGKPPLRRLSIRLGQIPHLNFYKLPVAQDSSGTVAITEKKTGFLYNSRPTGIRRLQFWDAQGRAMAVSWPKTMGFQVRKSDGKRIQWLTEVWGDVFADTPLPPWPDSAGTTFIVSFEQTLTVHALRLLGVEPNRQAGEIRFGLAGGLSQKLSSNSTSPEFPEYILPRPMRGRQFLLTFNGKSITPTHFTFITDQGPVWPRPGKNALLTESKENYADIKNAPSKLNAFINLPIFYHETRSYFQQPLRFAFRKDAKAQDTLPFKNQDLRYSLLILEDGRLHLTLREIEKMNGNASVILDKSYYGRWHLASQDDHTVILNIVWLEVNDSQSAPSGLPKPVLQTSSLTISEQEIRCANPLIIFPLPLHFRTGA